jgi:hypothetical protein
MRYQIEFFDVAFNEDKAMIEDMIHPIPRIQA